MLKLTKKADYALISVKHLAEVAQYSQNAASAKEIADTYALPQEALAKILQKLTRSGILISSHGTNGGYTLARAATAISAMDVIRAIDGPVAITSCHTHTGNCLQSNTCNVKEPLRKVNESLADVLGKLTIADMMEPRNTDSDDNGGREERGSTRAAHAGLVQLG